VRTLITSLALLTALVAGALATTRAAVTQPAAPELGGGFGHGYGIFHSYGWARGTAGYGNGACYWRPEICKAADED